MTGVYVDGIVVTKAFTILKRFAMTKMFLDVSLVALDWLVLNTRDEIIETRWASVARSAKVLRLVRILRLMKMTEFFRAVEKRIRSDALLISVRLAKHIFTIIALCHITACLWLGIGQRERGWVYHQMRTEQGDQFLSRYMTAAHWALSQIHGSMEVYPETELERFFATIVLLGAFVLSTWFVSSMTNLMVQLQSIRSGRTRLHTQLLQYMADRKLSGTLIARIKKFLESRVTSPVLLAKEVSLLKVLPRHMLEDIYEEDYSKMVYEHALFYEFTIATPVVVRNLAHSAMWEVSEVPDSCIFSTGDACASMLFVSSGRMHYVQGIRSIRIMPTAAFENSPVGQKRKKTEDKPASGKVLRENSWLCDAAIFTTWFNVGELTSISYSLLVHMGAEEFAKVVTSYPQAHRIAANHAQIFMNELNALTGTKRISDLMMGGHQKSWGRASSAMA